MKKRICVCSVILILLLSVCSCGTYGYGKDDGVIDAGVLVWKYSDTYGSAVRLAMKKYVAKFEEEKGIKIHLEMQDGNDDQATQNNQADVMFASGKDIVIINLCDVSAGSYIKDLAMNSDVPVLFYNTEPKDSSVITDTSSFFIGTTPEEAGVKQAEIFDELYKKDPSSIDKNGDGKIDYLMFMGPVNNVEALARTKYSIDTATSLGYDMQPLTNEQVCDWDTAKAQEAMQAQIAALGPDKIECVFCNNDDMAIGVIAALNNVGYNLSDKNNKEKTVTVLGVDATDTALEYIRSGKLSGTVMQDADAMGKAIITIACNKAQGNDYLEGTEYEVSEDGFSVRIPYAKITLDNLDQLNEDSDN